MEIISVENLTFAYPLSNKKVLEEISFSVPRGSFTAVCGATGSGKSTLLRLLKRELVPNGEKTGCVYFLGKNIEQLDPLSSASKIGYVMQRPEQQLVTDKVWHELAFGLENLGLPTLEIRRRVSEMASYFGIEDWFEKNVSELSGGQKQLLNLAAVMLMQPEVLLLDEPTAQLDPIAATSLIETVAKLNRDFALTVICVEHHLEEVLPVADHMLVLDKGRVLTFGETRAVIKEICESREHTHLLEAMPAAVRVYAALEGERTGRMAPVLTVREGRDFLEKNYRNDRRFLPFGEYTASDETALEFNDVYFRYSREEADVLKGLTFSVRCGEIFCLLGGNGSGKTTALSLAAGLYKPYSGKIRVFEKKIETYKNQSLYNNCLTLLPQDVQTVFLRNTVEEELTGVDLTDLPFDVKDLLKQHPYDLSGGQQQLVALAKVMATKPRLLLLDEPTKGIDAHTRQCLTDILKSLKKAGVTILCVTHDPDFAAGLADRCALMFRGTITSTDVPEDFFMANNFYTTSVNRMTRGLYDRIITVEGAVSLCRENGRRDL